MHRVLTCVLFAALTTSIAACDNKATDDGGGSDKGAPSAPATSRQPLGDLPLTGVLPEGARVVEQGGDDRYVQFGIKLGGVTLAPAPMPITDQAMFHERATVLHPDVTNLQNLEIPDGVGLTYENESPIGTNYNVHIVRTVGDAAWTCRTPADSEEERQRIIEFCNSLQPK